jgi:hypothetical protein
VPVPKRGTKAWRGPAIIEGLAVAIDQLQPGERLTQRILKRTAASQHRNVPTYSVAQRHATRAGTTFEALIREAEQLRRKSQTPPR